MNHWKWKQVQNSNVSNPANDKWRASEGNYGDWTKYAYEGANRVRGSGEMSWGAEAGTVGGDG